MEKWWARVSRSVFWPDVCLTFFDSRGIASAISILKNDQRQTDSLTASFQRISQKFFSSLWFIPLTDRQMPHCRVKHTTLVEVMSFETRCAGICHWPAASNAPAKSSNADAISCSQSVTVVVWGGGVVWRFLLTNEWLVVITCAPLTGINGALSLAVKRTPRVLNGLT